MTTQGWYYPFTYAQTIRLYAIMELIYGYTVTEPLGIREKVDTTTTISDSKPNGPTIQNTSDTSAH